LASRNAVRSKEEKVIPNNSLYRVVRIAALAAAAWSNAAVSADIRVSRQPGLPPEAKELIAEFEAQAGEILALSLAQSATRRAETAARLQPLLAQRMQAADLDGALAIRRMILSLERPTEPVEVGNGPAVSSKEVAGNATPAGSVDPSSSGLRFTKPIAVLGDPGDMSAYVDRVGQSILIDVTGTNDETVWGTDRYTYDSDLSTAAVHAGVVPLGGRRVVRVTMETGPASFVGSKRRGVASRDWDNSAGGYTAYRIEAAELPTTGYGAVQSWTAPVGTFAFAANGFTDTAGFAGPPQPLAVLPDPGTMLAFRGLNSRVFHFLVTGDGASRHTIWGTDNYTDDSRLSAAAVHAGVLKAGEKGVIEVTILPGQSSYRGSTRNGVTSHGFGAFDGSYYIGPRLVAGVPVDGGDTETTSAASGNDPALTAGSAELRHEPEGSPASPSRVDGRVETISKEGLLELLLSPEHELSIGCTRGVWRVDGDKAARYLGRVEMLEVEGRRAVGRVIPESRKGAVERGDYVSSIIR
jgi:hypothetical protein